MSVVFLDARHDGAGAPAFNVQVSEYIPGSTRYGPPKVSTWITTLDDPVTRWDDPRIKSGLTQRAARGEISDVILDYTSQATYLVALTDGELATLCGSVLVKAECLNRRDRPRVLNGIAVWSDFYRGAVPNSGPYT